MPRDSANQTVSILMPFLNAERFIQEAIVSVLAQEYPHWELLLVNDGSADGSAAIASRYSAQYPDRIRVYQVEGGSRGASAARNAALSHATGGYVAFLDADDVFLPHNLREQVSNLRAHPEAGVVCGLAEYWFGWTGTPADAKKNFITRSFLAADRLYRPPELVVRVLLRQHAPSPCTCSLLVRKAIMDAVGGFEESFRKVYTDQALYAKLFLATSVYVTNSCLSRYRQHPDSCCHVVSRDGEATQARSRFLNWMREYSAERGFYTSLQHEIDRAEWLISHPILARLSRTVGRRACRLATERAQ